MDFWTDHSRNFPPRVMPCYIPDGFLVRVFALIPMFYLHDAYKIKSKNR
jgi:hypothetical protein